jgi:hypothetical protein
MDKNDDLEKMLHESMQWKEGEQPEPNPEIQQRIRARIQNPKQIMPRQEGLLSRILILLNLEIKLYQAVLSLGVFAVLMICFPAGSPVPKPGESVVLADSLKPNACSSAKENKFLIRNFVVKVN